jgi:hypothetical protein
VPTLVSQNELLAKYLSDPLDKMLIIFNYNAWDGVRLSLLAQELNVGLLYQIIMVTTEERGMSVE